MSFRLAGDLPPTEEVTHLLGVVPTMQRRKGEPIPLGRKQPFDVWSLKLIERSEWEDGPPLPEATARAAKMLRHLTPGLAQLDRSVITAQLWISTMREEAQGGFDIPAEIIVAAGAAKLEVVVSVLIILEDDEDDEDGGTEAEEDAPASPGV
jgi:hypothetical protein